MDNNQTNPSAGNNLPPMNSNQPPNGPIPSNGFSQAQPVSSNQAIGPQMPNVAGAPHMQAAPGQSMTGTNSPNGMPMVQQVQAPPVVKKDYSGLIKTIAIIVLALIAVTFIGLFIWMTVQYNDARSDVDGEINAAVNKAKDEQATELENEFHEREKYPYKTFAGPIDYGELSFEYPKTWSVYVANPATSGGDFNAYFNPVQVDTVSNGTINALRVSIRNESFDTVSQEYQREMDRRNSNLSMTSVTIGKNGNITANRYTGTIPNTELSGFIVIFKIRDKTAILQTDSVLFQAEYDKLLDTITFNE